MIETFELRHGNAATRHWVGPGALAAGVEGLAPRLSAREAFVISASPVLALHGASLEGALRAATGRLEILEIPDGEAAKTVAVADTLWRRLSVAGARRDSLLIAFGGGSVGDLAGFVAGCYLRGVDWIQMPTTLLAQVDAAIGGKTAVDLPEAKNAVGLFHHPLAVIAEAAWLGTLGAEQIRSGLVEAVKTAAVLDSGLLDRIEATLERLLAGDEEALAPVVVGAARAKAALVESDPQESGPRMLLNFGHTIGHAVESEVGHGRIAHGDAVAHGLRFALRLSRRRGGDPGFLDRLERLLDRLGGPPLPALRSERLLARLGSDKKARRQGLAWVLAEAPGRGRIETGIPIEEVREELRAWIGERAPNSL